MNSEYQTPHPDPHIRTVLLQRFSSSNIKKIFWITPFYQEFTMILSVF